MGAEPPTADNLGSPASPAPFFFSLYAPRRHLHSFPTRRSSDLADRAAVLRGRAGGHRAPAGAVAAAPAHRSEEHTSELQSLRHLVCRLLLEKKNRTSVVAWSR